jgi:hypothetical protein
MRKCVVFLAPVSLILCAVAVVGGAGSASAGSKRAGHEDKTGDEHRQERTMGTDEMRGSIVS